MNKKNSIDIINQLELAVQSNEIDSNTVLVLFSLFDNDKDETDKVFHNNTFMPLLRTIFNNSELQKIFLKECFFRLSFMDDAGSEIHIINKLFLGTEPQEFKILVKDIEEEIANIIYQCCKKNEVQAQQYRKKERENYFYLHTIELFERIGNTLSSPIKGKIEDCVKRQDFQELLFFSRHHFFKLLSIFDFVNSVINPSIDLIEFLIQGIVKLERKYNLFEYGFNFRFQEVLQKASQFISKKLVKIIQRKVPEEIEAIVGVWFCHYLHLRDFIKLPDDAKRQFFISVQGVCVKYHERERANIDWQLGEIKYLESFFMKEHILEQIGEGNFNSIEKLVWNRFFTLLNESDFMDLSNEIGLNEIFAKKLLNLLKDDKEFQFQKVILNEMLKILQIPEQDALEKYLRLAKEEYEELWNEDESFYNWRIDAKNFFREHQKEGYHFIVNVIQNKKRDINAIVKLGWFEELTKSQLLTILQNREYKFTEYLVDNLKSALSYQSYLSIAISLEILNLLSGIENGKYFNEIIDHLNDKFTSLIIILGWIINDPVRVYYPGLKELAIQVYLH